MTTITKSMIITIVYKDVNEGLKDARRRRPEEPCYRLKIIDLNRGWSKIWLLFQYDPFFEF